MNLLSIRTLFVQRNGRYDLVVDTTDYADNGANFFIQSGQRLLDLLLPNKTTQGRYVVDINTGDCFHLLEQVRWVDEVWLKKSGSDRTEVTRVSHSWITANYGDDYGEKAKGTITLSGLPTAEDTITIDTETYTFKASASGTYEITIGDDVDGTIDNIVAKINSSSAICNAYKTSSSTCLIEYYLIGTAGNSIVFTESADNLTMDGSGTLGSTQAGRANGVTTGTPLYFAPLITKVHPDLTLANIGSYDTFGLMFGNDKFQKDGIVFMPPADQAYTMTIKGGFFSVLSSDTDTSYHSERFPELLLMAANWSLEAFYRNRQGMADWEAGMEKIVRGIDHDLVREEMVESGNQLKG